MIGPLRIGPLTLATPVVLAPMAGVTNAPFRTLCRAYAPGLLYVNEMVMATALVHGNAKTRAMIEFAPGERPRSLQLYGSDPAMVGEAVARLCDEGRVDHIDLNFGCPAAKVTRKGGGAAVPARPRLLRAIVRAAVQAAGDVPVTCKVRIGLFEGLTTSLTTGLIVQDEGVAAITLHARTAEQHYAGDARWEAIAELKGLLDIPVLGNGDIWEAADALAMIQRTGCDGVVVGRGCLGRPWLFRDLVDALAGRPVRPAPRLGEVVRTMRRHLGLLVDQRGEQLAVRDFRKHTAWYLCGYPVGGAVRHQLATASAVADVDAVLDRLDPDLVMVPGGERIRRGHTNGPIRVALPEGFLDDLDGDAPPVEDGLVTLSGG